MPSAPPRPRNRFDLPEWAGAFGDLGTLIPFVAAYLAVLRIDAAALLVPMGLALLGAGLFFRTPFPVQPMKAVGATAVAQASLAAGMSAAIVSAATLMTGLIWLLLALTGLAQRLARWVPRSALLGVVMGLGFSFMLEGIRLMSQQAWLAAVLLLLMFVMFRFPRLPAMLILLLTGVLMALLAQPDLGRALASLQPSLRWPLPAWQGIAMADLWPALVLLALPQLPLTFGNAYLSIIEENNRLFPDRPVTGRKVAFSTALMNLGSGLWGGVPLCHGAGGMAGHVQFGARTGGSSIILGVILLLAGLFMADSMGTVLRIFPPVVLGVILFLAGLQLALGSRDHDSDKVDRAVLLATAALATWNVGVAVLFGIISHHGLRRGWMRF